ncbi:MAG TPA: AI-2E family transporter [Acidobacteriota bacterium]
MKLEQARSRELLAWVVGLFCLALILYAAFLVFAPFAQPLAWAAIFAILLSPVNLWLRRWIRWDTPRALFTCLMAALILFGPVAALTTVLIGEAVSGLRYVQENINQMPPLDPSSWGFLGDARDWLESLVGGWVEIPDYQGLVQVPDLRTTIGSTAQGLSQWLLGHSSALIANLASFGLSFAVMVLALFYLLRDGDKLVKGFVELVPVADDEKRLMIERVQAVIISSVYGGIAVAVTQGVLGGLSFWLLGLRSPVLWATVMAFLSFLPVVGPALVWGPAAIVLAVQGRWVAGLVLVVWGAIVVGLADNFLRPMLIAGRVKMHPLLTFLAVLGGISAFGFLGLFLGPVLVAIVQALVEAYRMIVRDGEKAQPAPSSQPAG